MNKYLCSAALILAASSLTAGVLKAPKTMGVSNPVILAQANTTELSPALGMWIGQARWDGVVSDPDGGFWPVSVWVNEMNPRKKLKAEIIVIRKNQPSLTLRATGAYAVKGNAARLIIQPKGKKAVGFLGPKWDLIVNVNDPAMRGKSAAGPILLERDKWKK